MKKQKSNLSKQVMSLVMISLLVACAPKKAENSQDAGKIEVPAEKPVEQTRMEIKVFENVDASVKSQINDILVKYLDVVKALAEDNAEGAKTAAKTLTANLAKFDMSKLMGEQMDFYHVQEVKLSQALKGIDESIGIEEIRTELAVVSDSVYALVKAYDANKTEIYYDFCPMANNNEGAYWLSDLKEIRNPYMGQSMPHCGSVQETIN